MNAIRRFVGLFQNSPTFGRDRANLISGFSIGITALVLNGVILMMVLPVMLDPNAREFRQLTESMEFGQLLGLILLGGATAFATVLIPLRLVSVFLAPRIGRYFDQIVLSGITPLRFLIGKATSQNLFLALSLFLLLPWFVLVLSLGGLNWSVFLGNLFLLWLYCIMLALLMLWLSLYLNELLAMVLLVFAAAILCGLGCAPFPVQPFVVTPFPALMHSVYAAVNFPDAEPVQGYFSTFASCAAGMTIMSGVSLVAIYLGPLYGIIRENSTFGEVVRSGDSRRKRRFRFRLHIQRPSEIAFFYENRGNAFHRHEGLIRWGTGFFCLLIAVGGIWFLLAHLAARQLLNQWKAGDAYQYFAYSLYAICHTFHGIGLALAVLLFSHARNTTLQRLPLIFGWKVQVSRLDTIGFVLFLLISTVTCIGVPVWFDRHVLSPAGATMFPAQKYGLEGGQMDYSQVWLECPIALSVAGLTVCLLQRMLCLSMWLKTAALACVTMFYLGVVCIIPFIVAAMATEMPEFRNNPAIQANTLQLALMSPFTVVMFFYRELGSRVSYDLSTLPFYLLHGLIIGICLLVMRRQSRRLRLEYRTQPVQEIS